MKPKGLEFSDQHEMHALIRAVVSAKFSESPYDQDVPGSPIVNRVLKKLMEIQREFYERTADQQVLQQLDEACCLPMEHPAWRGVLRNILQNKKHFESLDDAAKFEFFCSFVEPFSLQPDVYEAKLKEIESISAGSLGK